MFFLTLVSIHFFCFDVVFTTLDAYDVNVSPDKRTILLHDQGAMLESIKVVKLYPQ